MTVKNALFTGAAILALAACGENATNAPSGEAGKSAVNLEKSSPLDRTFRLSDGEPVDADAILALMPGNVRPTYESAEFDESLGATVLSDLRFADADDGEAVVVERAEFYGVDLDAIERIQNADSMGGKLETVFEKVRFLNVSTEGFEDDETDAEVDLTIAGVEFDKLQIKPGLFADDDPGFKEVGS